MCCVIRITVKWWFIVEYNDFTWQEIEWSAIHNEVMMNWTNNEQQFDLLKRPVWRGIILALYVSIITVGIMGNGIVVYIVARNKNMHNITNIFIANLALSDIGLCVFSLPIQLYYQITDQWIFGECMCRIIFAAFAVPFYVSTLTILLIAFDRYWLIVFPLRNRMTVRTAFILLAVAAVISIVLSIPVVVFSTTEHVTVPDINLNRIYCMEDWPSDAPRIVFTVFTFLIQFCLPLAMTAILYYRIYCRLRHRPMQRSHNAERKQKTNKILVAIVTLFTICWLPWTLFSLLTEMDRHLVEGPHFKFVDLLLKAFAMGSACINPFLYCWLNENFRKELDNMAIRLHIIREPSRRVAGPTYRVQPPEDNGNTVTSPGTTYTADKLSTAACTAEITAAPYCPNNAQWHNGSHLVVNLQARPPEIVWEVRGRLMLPEGQRSSERVRGHLNGSEVIWMGQRSSEWVRGHSGPYQQYTVHYVHLNIAHIHWFIAHIPPQDVWIAGEDSY